jgi:DNA polymerase elongation subunit (family B)
MSNNTISITDKKINKKDSIVFQISEWREFDEISENSDNEADNVNYNDFMNENKNDKNASKKIKTCMNPKYYSGYKEDNVNRKYTIRMFGRTVDEKSVHVKVLNYSPHFYVELPDKWTDKNTDNLIKYLIENSELKHVKNNLIAYDIVSRHKFREFNNYKKFNFLRLIFNNAKAMKDFSYLFVKSRIFIFGKPVKFNVYESNIDSILRCMHIRNVPACGWVEIKKYNKCKENVSCDINIECDWKSLQACEDQNKFAKFKVAIFDIECDSGDGSFPQANRIEDKIIQIGTVFGKHNGDIYRKHIITLGSCDPIDDAEVISVNTEKELLIEWVKLIKEESPDFLSGYNIWQFDERYMYERALHPRINCQKLFAKLSKLLDYNSILEKSELSSSALGDNIMKYIDTVGITQLDLMKIIQAEHKLDKYSLDFVSEHFIQEKISNYTILGDYHLEIESKNLHFVKVGNYVKIINQAELEYGIKEENLDDDDDYENYCDIKYKILSIDGNKMIIESKDTKFSESGLKELGKGLKWGLVKDDIKPNDIFRLQRGSSKDRKMIAEYCIQDCVLVYKIMAKLDIITHKICMANVCYVPFYYLVLRGQGIKGLSLVSKKCREKEFLIPLLSKLENDVSYEGAIVFDPKTGFYQTYIPVLDYNSLYPSSMISHNISHEMIVIDSKYDNLPDYIYKDVTYENKDGTSSTCRYAKSKVQDKFGIIPEILMELLSERKKAKKMMESTNDPSEKSNYNGKQNSLKITANSIYGILGAGTSPLCMKELAASTTAVGRSMLETARNFVENDYVPILMQFYQALIDEDDETFDELIEIYLVDKRKENVDLIKRVVAELFKKYDVNPHVIYGDSCTGDTPLILNVDDKLKIQTFNDFDQELWIGYDGFKNKELYEQLSELGIVDKSKNQEPKSDDLTEKQEIDMSTKNIKIWTHNGWAKIKRVIRHMTDKKIYRVLTHNGLVDVTEDHSLLNTNVEQIKPIECEIGQELLHSFPDINGFGNNSIDESMNIETKKAYVYGFFVGDGSCGAYYSKYGVKYTWALNNNNLDVLNKCKEYLEETSDLEFKILDTIKSSGVYKLVPVKHFKDITLNYRKMFYDCNKAKIVPNEILNGSIEVRKSFLMGLYDSVLTHRASDQRDGCRKDIDKIGCYRIDTKNKITAQNYYYLLKSLGYNVSINDRKDKPNIFRLSWTKEKQRKNENAIKKIYVLHSEYNDYVYDIETESGVFHAGIGSLIIKNTDSIFVNMTITDKNTGSLLISKDGLVNGINLGELASLLIKKRLPYPHNLEYEKTFYPFWIGRKKGYVGNKYTTDVNYFVQSSMGIVMKRRDNANIVKKIMGGLINIVMNENDIDKALQYVRSTIENLLSGKYPITDFTTTKSLKARYKGTKKTTTKDGVVGTDGSWFWDDVDCGQAHVKMCQRMKARDPGTAPAVNDRIPSVAIIVPRKKGVKMLQGDMIEHPDYIKENNLKIDYLFYLTNQIMNPAVQFLTHIID